MSAESADGILVGAVDAGIMLNTIQTAAGALGYGTTAIGAVRSNPEKFIEMLNLPKHVYPIVGTTTGVSAKNELKTPKPRIPLDSFAFDEKYDAEKVKEGVEIFEKEFRNWNAGKTFIQRNKFQNLWNNKIQYCKIINGKTGIQIYRW